MFFDTYGMLEPIYGEHKEYEMFYFQYSMNIKYNLIFNFILKQNISNLPNFGFEIKESIENEHKRISESLRELGIKKGQTFADGKQSVFDDDLLIRKKFFGDDLEKFLNHITDYNQFILLYSIFENTIVQYMARYNYSDRVPQKKLIEKLLAVRNFDVTFLESFNKFSDLKIEISDLSLLWEYYTNVRNLFAHAGGIVGDEFKDKIEKQKDKLADFAMKIQLESLFIVGEENDIFGLNSVQLDKLFSLSEFAIRIFRNLIIYCWETIYLIDVGGELIKKVESKIINTPEMKVNNAICSSYNEYQALQTKQEYLTSECRNFYISGYVCKNCGEDDSFLYKTLFNKVLNMKGVINDTDDFSAEKVFTCIKCKSLFFPKIGSKLSDEGGKYYIEMDERIYFNIIKKLNSIGSNQKLWT